MGRRKGEKIMKIPAEFEDILRGVELTEREKRFLRWITSWDDHTMQNMRTVVEKVRSTLSTLQAENKELRPELEQVKRALAMIWFAYVNSDDEPVSWDSNVRCLVYHDGLYICPKCGTVKFVAQKPLRQQEKII